MLKTNNKMASICRMFFLLSCHSIILRPFVLPFAVFFIQNMKRRVNYIFELRYLKDVYLLTSPVRAIAGRRKGKTKKPTAHRPSAYQNHRFGLHHTIPHEECNPVRALC
jgi:hypothetical protein